MGRNAKMTSILLATTSFIGGFATGLLLAPKKGSQNRAWVTGQANVLANWLDNQRKSVRYKGTAEFQRIRQGMQSGLKRNIPDLYEATEDIGLSHNDIISE